MAATATIWRQLCVDPRCGTLLPGDAEICDECGGELGPLPETGALLMAIVADRQVGYLLDPSRESTIGRGVPDEATPDVDLSPMPGSDSVHRLHASVAFDGDAWQVTHRGRNPLVIRRADQSIPLKPESTAALQSGDTLIVGRLALAFVAV